jgi:hypothetical protein
MRFILASDDRPSSLAFSATQSSEQSSELLDFTPVLRPVSGTLRRDSAVVVPLRLAQELGVRS